MSNLSLKKFSLSKMSETEDEGEEPEITLEQKLKMKQQSISSPAYFAVTGLICDAVTYK